MDFHCDKCKKITTHKSVNKPAEWRERHGISINGDRGFFEQALSLGTRELDINLYRRYRECQECEHVTGTVEMSDDTLFWIEQLLEKAEAIRTVMLEWKTQAEGLIEKTTKAEVALVAM